MTASTRRAALGAILAAPLASAPAVAADPHVARLSMALALYRRHRDTERGWSEPSCSPACEEANEAHAAVMLFATEACEMPPPTTMAGLGVLALSVALSEDQTFTSTMLDNSDRLWIALLEAVLAVTGVTVPADRRGLVYHPEDQRCA